jgi:hypothetical protein
MYYRAQNELIVTSERDENGSTVSRFVDKNKKKDQWGKLNYIIGGEIRKNDLHTRYKDKYSHTVNEVFNYCPIVLNYIALRGYKKVLFVGHFNAAQRSWTFPRKSDRNLFPTPAFRSSEDTMVDPHIWVQFLPIVRMAYGYDFEMHTVSPPESRNRQLMHSLYKRYQVDLVPSNMQYKHVNHASVTTTETARYDCVVFAGVPKSDEDVEFTINEVKNNFQSICTPDADFIDLNYQDPDDKKFVNGALYPNSEWLHECFALRGVWDETFNNISSEDRALEYKMIDTMINSYRG